ncbi:MAG TPA: hypothetical protein VFG65_06070, partial [Fimbriimonadales bacterium]|nr:hypothetical protein [Fimbriimonadales bacterium]
MPRLLPHSVYLETDLPDFPAICACCCEQAQTEYRLGSLDGPAGMIRESISLPYCQACLGHFREWQRSNNANLVAANIGIWGLAACFAGHLSAYLLPIGPVAAGGYLIYRKRVGQMPLKPTCATRDRACVVVWHRGPT